MNFLTIKTTKETIILREHGGSIMISSYEYYHITEEQELMVESVRE